MVARIIRARHKAKLTQTELAERVGRPEYWLRQIEKGQRRLEAIEVVELALALGLSPDAFLPSPREVLAENRALRESK